MTDDKKISKIKKQNLKTQNLLNAHVIINELLLIKKEIAEIKTLQLQKHHSNESLKSWQMIEFYNGALQGKKFDDICEYISSCKVP